ncbi:MAG TPA: uL30 family ribosomal protein [Candidatus Binatia bacterium]|nr:uL30 family ribosomal protein [Candidatus Binatia bacterium]
MPALKEGGWLAVIRIRSAPKMSTQMEQTLYYLHLPRRHSCIVIQNNPTTLGMITKVQNYVTWGEVSDDVVKQLESKALKNKAKHSFGLKSPKKDIARKGIKLPTHSGGALGFRKDIAKLITRMM